jgi:DNA-binding transcriptional LysR family regulator
MDRAAEMTALVRSVETGGFSAAARDLGLTPSALSKLVTRLEARLGARLLQRSTRRLQLTPEGEAFYARARRILADMDDAEAEVIDAGVRPRGLLRLHCGSAFGMHQLAPVIPLFLERHPDVDLDITISDQPLGVLDEGVDLAIRIGPLDESSLVARRICNLERVICAAPSYLARHGTPHTPDELQQHNCLWITSLPVLRRWPFDTDDGIRVVHIDGNVVANNAETVLQLAVAGVGITRLTDVIVGEAIRRGDLVPILTDWNHVEPVPLYATYPSGRHLSPKVRVMVDFLVEQFGNTPWRRVPAGRKAAALSPRAASRRR